MGLVTRVLVVCDASGCTTEERLDYHDPDEAEHPLPVGWACHSYRPPPRPEDYKTSAIWLPGNYVEIRYYCPKHVKKP